MADDRRPERTEPSENRPPAHATAGNSTADGDTCDPGSVERVHRGDRGLEGISFGPLLFGGSRIVRRPAALGQLRRYLGSLRFPRFSALVHMRALGLDQAASELDSATQKAITRNDSPTSLLDHLMRDQLRVHLEGRARAALKRAAIFPLTTLDTYDFDYPKTIDRDVVVRAATLDFIRDKANCVFLGPSGVGKTHLANAIGQLACLRGHRVRFVLAADLVNDLVSGQARNTLHRRLAAWAAPDLLLIDELGYLSFDARGADLLYQVFNKRYQRSSTIVTTNLPFKDWGTLFHNSAAASAIADRLVHKGLLVRITGKSRRSDQEVS